MDRLPSLTITATASVDYANTATISAAEADNNRNNSATVTEYRSTNVLESPKRSTTHPKCGSNVIFTLTANGTKCSYNRIGW
jgi:hypothetical protein